MLGEELIDGYAAAQRLHEQRLARGWRPVGRKIAEVPLSAEPDDLLACIAWVAHACEIVQCPHPDWKVKLADSTASNGLHGRLMLGRRVPANQMTDLIQELPGVEALLFKGDALVERGRGENVLGSPLLALGHLRIRFS